MNHELSFDNKQGLMIMRIKGDFTVDDAIRCGTFVEEVASENETYDVIVDLREATPNLDKDVRKMLKDQATRDDVRKFAMIVTHPALRIIGKIATSSMKNGKIFKTENEALVWLKGE